MADTLQISYSLSNIEDAAHQFWQYLHQYRTFAFSGEMGAGKTTFIHALCNVLGVKDNVSSPTFALINEYRFFSEQGTVNSEQRAENSEGFEEGVIYHMDWYRLKDEEEAIQAGMEDALMQKNALCFIEWPEKAKGLLPASHVWIEIDVTDTEERKMMITIPKA